MLASDEQKENETMRVAEEFIAAKESFRSEIESWLGHRITSGGFVWVLVDWNYRGVLYWRRLDCKIMCTIEGYKRVIDLAENKA